MSRAEYPPEYDEPQGNIDYEDSDEHFVGNTEGIGCSYLVGKCRCCGAFHIHVWFDTEDNIDDLVKDDGPYATEEAALTAAKNVSTEWCMNNEVNWSGFEVDLEYDEMLEIEYEGTQREGAGQKSPKEEEQA